MTASTAYRTPSQGKSFPYGTVIIFCFAIVLLGITVRWLTTNTSTTTGVTATTVTATTATIATIEATAVAKALMDGTTTQNLYSLVSAYVVAYNPAPTVESLNETLKSLTDKINKFTSKKWVKVVKHRCPKRPSWGLCLERNGKDIEVLHFEWDKQHGDLEVYSPKVKVHLGSIPVMNIDEPRKPNVATRVADCICK